MKKESLFPNKQRGDSLITKPDDQKEIANSGIEDIDLFGTDGIIQFKIVYWGPGESGKTTNFKVLRNNFPSDKFTTGYSIETTDGRTLWHDSVVLGFTFELGDNKYSIITHIVTCTGQERFLDTREYVLDGADGIIFVGDSEPEQIEQNKRSFRELKSFAISRRIPYLVQLNKRDLELKISISDFKRHLGLPPEEKYPDETYVVYPVIASEGKNVLCCFWDLISQVLYNYFRKKIND